MENVESLFTPIKTQRVYTRIVDQVIDLIKKGDYRLGSQLPIERDFARILGVSRASLREALTVLQMMGIIETIPGQGTFICERTDSEIYLVDLKDVVNEESPMVIIEARKAFEPQVAAFAALKRSKEAIKKLEEIVDMAKDGPTLSPYYFEADRSFHLAMAVATGNPAIIQMQTIIYNLEGQKLWRIIIKNTNYSKLNHWQKGFSEHLDILEAIKVKNPEAAERTMRNHLQTVEGYMIGLDKD